MAVVADHQAGHERHLPDQQREDVLELGRQPVRVLQPGVDVGAPRQRQHHPPQAPVQQPGERRHERGEHHEQPQHVEHPRTHVEQQQLAHGVPRRRVVEEPRRVDVEVVDLAAGGGPAGAGAPVGERRDRGGVEARDQPEQVDAEGEDQGREVDLAGPLPAHHGRRPLAHAPHERLVDHAEHDAGEHHEPLGAGDRPDPVEGDVGVEAGQLGVGDDDGEDQPARGTGRRAGRGCRGGRRSATTGPAGPRAR